MTESTVQQAVRLAAAQRRCQLWRNNVGACEDKNGRFIRYGLCNDSKQLNALIKSSDLIGVTPVTVTPDMVGKTIGVFTAVECKAESWVFTAGDKRAHAQAAFHEIVRNVGWFAGFARSVEDFERIVG